MQHAPPDDTAVQHTATTTLAASAPLAANAPRRLSSSTLMGTQTAVAIEHQGTTYILRTTRAGKLILTK
jgi:hemin uptake protein HemP